MSFRSRVLISVVRNRQKTVLLFLLTLTLGALMAGMLLVNGASARGIENVAATLQPQGMIGIDQWEVFDALTDPSTTPNTLFIQNLCTEFIRELESLPYVAKIDYFFERPLFSSEVEMYTGPVDEPWGLADRRVGLGYAFQVRGVSNPYFVEIEQNIIEIIHGRTFTEEEFNGAYPVAIISEELALKNQLFIGSTVSFRSTVFNPIKAFCGACRREENTLGSLFYDIEVIGIFSISSSITSPNIDDQWANVFLLDGLSNRVYVSGSFLEQVDKETRQLAESEGFHLLLSQLSEEPPVGTPLEGHYLMASEFYSMRITSFLRLYSFYYVNAFMEEVSPLLPDLYKVEFADNNYQVITNALELLRGITNNLLYLTIGSTILILALLIILFMRGRKHEIGIYFALGEQKEKVALQMIGEILIVTIPALIIALLLGNFFGNQIAEHMLINDLLEAETQGQGVAWSLLFMFGLGTEQMNINALLESYESTLSIGRALVFLCVGVGTIFLAIIAPLLYVFRMSPKKILM